MGFAINRDQMNALISRWQESCEVYAPKRFVGAGRYTDLDVIRYDKINTIEEAVLDEKSNFSYKDVLTPISQTLFYFAQDKAIEAEPERKKGAVIFLRACDLNGLRALDEMYLHNGNPDYYYSQLRENCHFVLIGCPKSFSNCFCVSMGTNRADNYDMSIDIAGDGYLVDVKDADWAAFLKEQGAAEQEVTPASVTENEVKVTIPENLTNQVAKSKMWDEYDARCIACGRCTLVCPTCTCYTMQDLFYTENGKVGERRRVQASCMVDGYSTVAGGASYRKKNGERMRFKALHKVLDFRKRSGFNMCVGCGRCDDTCPEYISFSTIINKLEGAMEEVNANGQK